MPDPQPDTDQLLGRAASGDSSAIQELLDLHRRRLRRMVAVHLDPRISARVDPSDVVQEALVEAYQRLPAYARDRTISFYPWLRQIAWQRLVKLQEKHLTAARRSVEREEAGARREAGAHRPPRIHARRPPDKGQAKRRALSNRTGAKEASPPPSAARRRRLSTRS